MSRPEIPGLGETVKCPGSFTTLDYTYKPLNFERSIRLLVLHSASSTDCPLQCDLQEVLLSDHRNYEAISYAWGELVLSQKLELPQGSLKITENLSLALRRFRHKDQVRYLWADAVCINQADNIEKAKQVTLMGDIYKNCKRVLVWLGPGDKSSGNIIPLLKHVAARSNLYGVERDMNGLIPGSWAGLVPPTDDVKERLEKLPIEHDWKCADAFYSIPWFSRMWIVQEIILGPFAHLYYGDFDISWEDLILAAHVEYRSVHRVTAKRIRLPFHFFRIMRLEAGMRRFQITKQYDAKLLDLLSNFRSSDCSDPRDRIYSLLGLRGPEDVEITPSYDEPATETFIRLTRKMFEKSVGYAREIFYYAGVSRRFRRKDKSPLDHKNTVHDIKLIPALEIVCKDLPSWVPDWRIPGDYRSFHIFRNETAGYSAATNFLPQLQIDTGDDSLDVMAWTVDIVKAGQNLGLEPDINYNAHREQVLLMKKLYDDQVGPCKPENEDEAITVFARVILADATQSVTHMYLREPLSAQDFRDLWLQFASTPYKDQSTMAFFESDDSENMNVGQNMEKMAETKPFKPYSRLFCYRMALKNLLDDRQFIVTNSGRAGLAPALAQPGDHIVVIAGARTPLVLRPTVENQYYIIGDCFIHGIMYGEMNDVLKTGLWEWKKLR